MSLLTPEDFLLLQTTCNDEADCTRLARGLVEARLAACVQRWPVQSCFHWKGKVEESSEWLLVAKVRRADYSAAEAWLLAHHPYELPECVAVRLDAGAPAFLAWWQSTGGPE
jgi:periplasmic divalent cation tolerance protein